MQSSSITTTRVPLPRSAVALPATTAPTQEPPIHDFPDLTTTVPRQYVHRAAVSEVFPTNWEADGAGGYIVAAQWPRGHALFTPRSGQQDPMLIAETVRQSGMLLVHAEFNVPLDHHFLLWDISFTSSPGALAAGPTPTDVTLRVRFHDMNLHGRQLSSFRVRAEIWRGPVRVAVSSSGSNCISPAVYRRIRGDRPLTLTTPPAAPLDPETVGRRDVRDVVLADPAAVEPLDRDNGHARVTDLADRAASRSEGARGASRSEGGRSETRRRWPLRVDTTHPFFFDHAVDHVPGMLLVEAARQAAQALLGPRPVQPIGIETTFERFAELTVPVWIEAETGQTDASGDTPVRVSGHQDGEVVFTATVTTRPLG